MVLFVLLLVSYIMKASTNVNFMPQWSGKIMILNLSISYAGSLNLRKLLISLEFQPPHHQMRKVLLSKLPIIIVSKYIQRELHGFKCLATKMSLDFE